jgi:hypothetical protein
MMWRGQAVEQPKDSVHVGLVARNYISASTVGDASACERDLARIDAAFEGYAARLEDVGWGVSLFRTADEFDEEGLADFVFDAAGRYPFLFVNCTWEGSLTNEPSFLATIVREYGLREVQP